MACTSIWLGDGSCATFPSLRGDVRVDVVVIGGGITGLTAALLLKRAGKRVAVVEARAIGQGVTGGTTAHLTQAVDARYAHLLSSFGPERTAMVAESTRASMDRIAAFVRELGIACEHESVPGFLYSESEEDLQLLHEELEAAQQVGIRVSMTRSVPLPYPVAAAVRFEDQAQFNPCRYVGALAAAVDGDGSYVFEGTHARDVDDGSPCKVTADNGSVTADAVVLATDSPLTKFFVQTKIAPYRSYALAFVPRAPIAKALFWDTADPYHYVRTAEMAGVQYVVVGGEDHKTGQEEDTSGCFARLTSWARDRFAFDDVPYRWSAQVMEPMDGLPFIGRSSTSSNVWLSTGYSGTGMTFGTLGGMLLSDALQGRSNIWADLYDAHRVHASGVKDFVAENLDVASYMLGDRLRGAEGTSIAEVRAGEGKVLRLDGKKVAVFRDEQGGVHALSPVCPHLGCLVHFNNAEKTWDCPCHGSRFSTRGEVLHGPALADLAPASGPSIPPPPDVASEDLVKRTRRGRES